MAQSTPTLSPEQIAAKLLDLQSRDNVYSYDIYSQGLKMLNPRFAEIDALIKKGSGLHEQFTKALNENPVALRNFIDAAKDNQKLDDLAKLLSSEKGAKEATLALASGNSMKPLGAPETTTVQAPTHNLMAKSGMSDIAASGGTKVALQQPIDFAKVGDFLYDNFVWDSDAPLWLNLASQAMNVGSVAAGAMSFGAGTAGGLAIKTSAMAGLKRMFLSSAAKTALNTGAKTVSKTVTKTLPATFAREAAEAGARKAVKTTAQTIGIPKVKMPLPKIKIPVTARVKGGAKALAATAAVDTGFAGIKGDFDKVDPQPTDMDITALQDEYGETIDAPALQDSVTAKNAQTPEASKETKTQASLLDQFNPVSLFEGAVDFLDDYIGADAAKFVVGLATIGAIGTGLYLGASTLGATGALGTLSVLLGTATGAYKMIDSANIANMDWNNILPRSMSELTQKLA